MDANWLVSREYIETDLIKRKLSEDEWETISEEIAGRVDNFINEILEGVIEEAING